MIEIDKDEGDKLGSRSIQSEKISGTISEKIQTGLAEGGVAEPRMTESVKTPVETAPMERAAAHAPVAAKTLKSRSCSAAALRCSPDLDWSASPT